MEHARKCWKFSSHTLFALDMLITSNAISHKQDWQQRHPRRELQEQQKCDLFKLLHAENFVAPLRFS